MDLLADICWGARRSPRDIILGVGREMKIADGDAVALDNNATFEDEWAGGEVREQAGAWPRLWARLFDLKLLVLPVSFVGGVLFPDFFTKPIFNDQSGSYLVGFICLPFVMVVDALIQATCGTTIGKALAGVRLETIRHEKLNASTTIKRNLMVYFRGLLMGIPLLSLISMSKSRDALQNEGQTSWDRDLFTRVYADGSSPARTFLIFIAVFLIQALSVGLDRALPAEQVSYPSSVDVRSSDAPAIDPIAAELAGEVLGLNKDLPKMVDPITRLESVEAEGRSITYRYALLRRDADDETLRTFILKKTCADAKMREFMKNYQIEYRNVYSIPNGGKALEIRANWASCATL